MSRKRDRKLRRYVREFLRDYGLAFDRLAAEEVPAVAASILWPTIIGGTTVRCTCPPNRGDNYAGNCPIHDVHTTYTVPS